MKLADIATYVTDKICSRDIQLHEYVTTDSLLQNKKGRECAQNLPPVATNLVHFQVGDVLVANIRPYLKKVWLADTCGGCSSDVLVFRPHKGHSSNYLYATIIQDSFFNHVMNGSKGSKMPRGDKNQIMRYKTPTLSSCKEENVGKLIFDINKKIQLNNSINHNLPLRLGRSLKVVEVRLAA